MENLFPYPKQGFSFLEILEDSLTRKLLGHDVALDEDALPFVTGVATRLEFLLRSSTTHLPFLKIGYSALEAFLQSNCTGPPLDFDSAELVIPKAYRQDEATLAELRRQLAQSLAVDGVTAYAHIPHIELFWLAKVCMSNATLAEEGFNGRRARFRVGFVHQRLLLEKSDTLKEEIYACADILGTQLASRLRFNGAAAEEHYVEYLLERAAIAIYYGDGAGARENLVLAAKTRKFQFALTGALGKRTKFQDRDISQLVVLAKSRDVEPEPYSSCKPSRADGMDSRQSSAATDSRKSSNSETGLVPLTSGKAPTNIPLNDDTLLEAINWTPSPKDETEMSAVADTPALPSPLASLDPANQPLLFPMDSIILLNTASSISNTSPSDGLTREETLPYAARVLEGGSSNWQVYSQALLVRSRIEGYRSRTADRGLLQLQALVDQVIAETTNKGQTESPQTEDGTSSENAPTTFLPKLKASESASPAERLRYIYQLSSPLRWELEAELAARWVNLGGLKTALEIYERLEMHAEVALCLAGTEQEAEAIHVVRKLLFEPSTTPSKDGSQAQYDGPELASPPAEAPRLFCILGDLEGNPEHYRRAWLISKRRYARAPRLLGRYFVKRKQFAQAAEAYKQSLEINRLNASTWFAIGCVYLELEDWTAAVDSFTRAVQLENDDAEAWSNLAAALMRLPALDIDAEDETTEDEAEVVNGKKIDAEARPYGADSDEDEEEDDDDDDESPLKVTSNQYKHARDALSALRRAAQLKREDARIWDNYLTVAASLPPPWTPWADIIMAQKRVIELRGKVIGEKAADEQIIEVLVEYVGSEFEYPKADTELKDEESVTNGNKETATLRPGSVPHELIDLMDNFVQPLITSSDRLWRLVAKLAIWRQRPLAALEAHERAWRVVTSLPGVYETDEKHWIRVVDATQKLVEAYKTLAGQERERTGGKVIEGNWRFKARTAIRGVLGKGKEMWADTAGSQKLQNLMETLSSSKTA